MLGGPRSGNPDRREHVAFRADLALAGTSRTDQKHRSREGIQRVARELRPLLFEEDDLLDATSLLVPITGFLPFDDERVQGTIDATLERLVTADGLVDRYEGRDGLPGGEGAFLLRSFWLVDALSLSGRTDEAVEIFENVVGYANPLGLFSEEVDPSTGAHLGNTPQAFSHIGLINSALYLESVLGEPPEPLPRGAEVSAELR